MQVSKNLALSGLVVCYNEGHLLSHCLRSLNFCSELIVIDLESSDNSVQVARALGAKVISHPRVTIVEHIRNWALAQCTHTWVALLDPDEVLDTGAQEEIIRCIENKEPLAQLVFPWIFYFKGTQLRSTRWGYKSKIKPVLVHKERINFSTQVHSAYEKLYGFEERRVTYNGNNALRHYWCSSYTDFLQKHWRYIKMQGEADYHKGNRFSFYRFLVLPFFEAYLNLFKYQGYKEPGRGYILSMLWACYVCLNELSLAAYQFKLRKKD